MIKKINVALAIAFAVLLTVKGLKQLKDAATAQSATRQNVAAAQQADVSSLAPHVYYGYWAGYTLENPISNRNGILLDIVRAVFPKATFSHVHGNVEAFAKIMQEDPNAVVVGFGTHPELKKYQSAPTPLMHCPLVLMTLRTNPWRYKEVASLDELRIVADEAFLDYKVIRDLQERAGQDSKRLRIMPSTVSKVVMAEMVAKGEADAFVMADLAKVKGAAIDGLASARFIQHFRKSKPIANDGTLVHVSGKNAAFAKSLVEEYEAGLRRIDKNGMRRRIYEYYGLAYEPVKP